MQPTLPSTVLRPAEALPASDKASLAAPHNSQESQNSHSLRLPNDPSGTADQSQPSCSPSPLPSVSHCPDSTPSTHCLLRPSAPLPLSALASILGCTRSTIRHFADRLGFRYTVRRIGARHKRAACLTPHQATAIAAEVERDAAEYASASGSVSSSSSPSQPHASESPAASEPRTRNHELSTAEGQFYLLQLEPQHDPGRFKLGFSSDLDSRLDDLLTVVPLAKLIATWPAHRSWERIAIISAAQNAEVISQEVFRCDDIQQVVAAANRFFAVMPKLADTPDALIPERPKERWFPTTDDPPLPEAAISQNRAGPGSEAESPFASSTTGPVINHPSPSQPTRVSARTPVLPMIPIPPPACGGSPPGSACEMNLRAAAASESPP